MTDPRFFRRSGPFSLSEIAQRIDAEPMDDESGRLMIHDIAALETAGPHEVTVFNDARYRSALAASRAGAIVTSRDLAGRAPNGNRLLIVAQPRLAYAQIGRLFYPAPALVPGVPRAPISTPPLRSAPDRRSSPVPGSGATS
jgi:UDP-3-O-[3-hydroxymyristoyl] glucosamine N-acyltransferase